VSKKKGVFGKCVRAVVVNCLMCFLEEATFNNLKDMELKAFQKTFWEKITLLIYNSRLSSS
jgi:hypothetical protein